MLIQLVTALGLAAVPAPPAANSAAEPPEIVVKGRRDVGSQVDDFVKALNDVRSGDQISRFDWAVCPSAMGLSDRQNANAAARMRVVAEAAGIKVAPANCKSNVLLIVTDDKAKFVDWLEAKHPSYFDGVPDKVMRQLGRTDVPVAAWQVEGLLDADGVALAKDRDTGQYTNERTDTPSRISTSTRPHFSAAIVVVDSKALAGLTVVQLADYAAMRAFARTDPSRASASGAPTILNVIDAPMNSAVPITLTEWDLAYLKALYASPGNRLAGQQRRDMQRTMAKELSKQPGQQQ